jgi:hypothetical protein
MKAKQDKRRKFSTMDSLEKSIQANLYKVIGQNVPLTANVSLPNGKVVAAIIFEGFVWDVQNRKLAPLQEPKLDLADNWGTIETVEQHK